MSSYEIGLLSKLVEIDTNVETKKGYDEFVKVLAEEAGSLGLDYRTFNAREESVQKVSLPSIVIDYDAQTDLTVALAAHYDTVPPGEGWSRDPLKLTIEGGRAYGRGACDDKGDIVAGLGALKVLKESGRSRYNVAFAITPEEEVGGELGLGYLIRNGHLRADWAIVLDASPKTVSVGASGVAWGKITFKGKQGHAAYPHRARNPIEDALPVLNELRRFSKEREKVRSKLPAQRGSPFANVWGRFTITMLNSGFKENVIPGTCEARFDMRICPDERLESAKRQLKRYFKRALRKHGVGGELEFVKDWPPYRTRLDHPLVREFTRAASRARGARLGNVGELAANDGRFFSAENIPVICYGVLRDDCRFHGADEFVHLKDIELVKSSLVNFFIGQ